MPAFYSLGERPDKDIYAAGLNYFYAPRYSGSAESRNVFAPSATAILTNGLFADVVNGVGCNFSTDKRFEYGLRATLGLGRIGTGSLEGMGRIPDTINLGGFANFNATERLQLQSTLRYGSGYGRDGTLVDAGASFDVFKRDHVSLSLDASLSWADRRYMRSFYGVSASQSLASGYAPYAPGSGLQWVTAGISAEAPVHPKALASVSVEYMSLRGQAVASPYARRTEALMIQANVSYGF